jgi:hypothetical protein
VNENTILMLIVGAFLALGFKLILDRISKRAEEKRKDEEAARWRAHRDARDDKRPTMGEQLDMELSSARSFAVRGEDEARRDNAIYARILMEDDLGRYAEGPRPYEMDQDHRDILLAHARKDAAEALANTRTVLAEVRGIRRTIDEIVRVAIWLLIAFIVWSWWKSGFMPWGK